MPTASARTASVTSSPLSRICWLPVPGRMSRRMSGSSAATAAASLVLRPARRAYSPMARYMAPVST